MPIALPELSVIYPDQLLLEFSVSDKQLAWAQIEQQQYRDRLAKNNAFLNQLCLNIFLYYWQHQADIQFNCQVYNSTELASFWSVVNGTAVTLNDAKLVLMPLQTITKMELCVPREWLEINHWIADYYLAVEINLEACWMIIYGYATYERLTTIGYYDSTDETYSLPVAKLTEDLNVLWTIIESYSFPRAKVKPIPSLSTTTSKKMLTDLSQPEIISPRLVLSFPQWLSFIANDRLRQNLYQARQQQITPTTPTAKANLQTWLENKYTQGWQSLATTINRNQSNLAYNFRGLRRAESDIKHEGVKLLDFNLELGTVKVALLIGITQENKDRLSIRVQLHPIGSNNYLPHNIKLLLLTRSNKILQQINSRTQDRLIQLKKFTCFKGQHFTLQVSFSGYDIVEEFIA